MTQNGGWGNRSVCTYIILYIDVFVQYVQVWNTAQRQGLKSGTFFWPGSDAPINGIHHVNLLQLIFSYFDYFPRHVPKLLREI